jgi:hypothetical protein
MIEITVLGFIVIVVLMLAFVFGSAAIMGYFLNKLFERN